jgi:hypothetical protein
VIIVADEFMGADTVRVFQVLLIHDPGGFKQENE